MEGGWLNGGKRKETGSLLLVCLMAFTSPVKLADSVDG